MEIPQPTHMPDAEGSGSDEHNFGAKLWEHLQQGALGKDPYNKDISEELADGLGLTMEDIVKSENPDSLVKSRVLSKLVLMLAKAEGLSAKSPEEMKDVLDTLQSLSPEKWEEWEKLSQHNDEQVADQFKGYKIAVAIQRLLK